MFATSILLSLALAAPPGGDGAAGDPHLADCEITTIYDQYVPAPEAGRLVQLNVYEGMPITAGTEIAQIDKTEAAANLKIKQYELDAAKKKADSDVNIKHAKAAYGVAYFNLERYREANKNSPKSVSEIEIKHHEFELKKAELAIEQSQEELVEAKLTSKAKQAEVEAAQVMLDRLSLKAPFDGIVVGIEKQKDEWVTIGEPVVQVMDVKRLRVKGRLDASQWGPGDVANRRVTVEVSLPRGRSVSVPGKVTYVSPVVVVDAFEVWAEIESPMEKGMPVVRAGLPASMTVHVDQPVAARQQVPVRSTADRRPQ
ncbi:MAG: HlyD family efflux transporter periplasmic adaptor subunit [Planctomycetota bacterium]|nr:MAG: HlyD family efflux transporter periplasmic adaptor subunit [Planctomycetota bacterium]